MSGGRLALQDPSNGESEYLLETLLQHASEAQSGGAAYAWATGLGVWLLLRDEVFEALLQRGSFHLVVGIDEITTPHALNELIKAQTEHPSLTVEVFSSGPSEGLFHPKFAWFDRGAAASVVVGSGNLTGGGLRDNREAFGVIELTPAELVGTKKSWDGWLQHNFDRLFPVDSAEAFALAEANAAWTRGQRRRKPDVVPEAAPEPDFTGMRVLIAEIPRSGNRWNQANFDKDTYERFFGAKVGTQRRMLFQSVEPDGRLGPIERRPSVQVASHNYRFELEAGAGINYPGSGRPIGVFLRTKPRTFVYMLSLPGDAGHDGLVAALDASPGGGDLIRRYQADAGEVAGLEPVGRLLTASDEAFLDETPE